MVLPSGYRFPDLSHYRTVCTWADHDYPVAACKATEGASGKDSYFPTWMARMRALGRLPIPYHFLRAEPSVSSQVQNYLSTIDDGKPFAVMLDVETSGVGTNPSIGAANEWFNQVKSATGIPRSCMLLYMPRWWYNAFGGGSTVLKDTILWQSAYTNSPNMSGYAGDNFEMLQYSSTAPIAGLCSPGTGDMNIAINMSPTQLIQRITSATPEDGFFMALTDAEQKELLENSRDAVRALQSQPLRIVRVGFITGDPVYISDLQSYIYPIDQNGPYDTLIQNLKKLAGISANAVRLNQDVIDDMLKTLPSVPDPVATVDVDAQALADALAPLLPGLSQADLDSIRQIVDSELDKRSLAD